jgi:hypothetical protein
LGRFEQPRKAGSALDPGAESNFYKVPRPGILWNGNQYDTLPEDGGQKRRIKTQAGPKPQAKAKARLLF